MFDNLVKSGGQNKGFGDKDFDNRPPAGLRHATPQMSKQSDDMFGDLTGDLVNDMMGGGKKEKTKKRSDPLDDLFS